MSIHKYETKKGTRYLVKIYMTRDGKRHDHLKRGFKSKKEAKAYELTLTYQKATGRLPETLVKPTTSESYQVVFEQWYKAYKDTVEPTTAAKTWDLFRLHILPVFGSRRLDKISPLDCQLFITDKAQTFRNIKQIKSYTAKVFDFAIRMRTLSHNPMADVLMPRRERRRSSNYWSVQELKHFLNIVQSEESLKHYAIFRLLAYSGLRKGELYALRWSDVDFQKQLLTVDKSLGRIDGKALEKGTKNSFSTRQIYLDSETLAILGQWQKESSKEKDLLPRSYADIVVDHIFTYITSKGTIEPLHADYINNILKRLIRKHQLKPISPHGFRHTHATLMTEIGTLATRRNA